MHAESSLIEQPSQAPLYDRREELERQAEKSELFAEMGLSIFAIHHPDEKPFDWLPGWGPNSVGKVPPSSWEKWQKRHPTAEERRKMFRSGVRCNIAIVTGEISGIVVIDADTPEAMEWIDEKLPSTPLEVESGGGGRHYYFRFDPLHPLRNATALFGIKGLDVRGEGGFIVGPGSRHRSGFLYCETCPTAWRGGKL